MRIVVLPNQGNTCYINSILQTFLTDPIFLKLINKIDHDGKFINQLKYLTNQVDLHKDTNELIRMGTNELMNEFRNHFNWFIRFQQHDTHELFTCFMDLLIKETPCPTLHSDINPQWNQFLNKNSSIFTKYYHGQTKLGIMCTECRNYKEVFEEFNTINLNVPMQDSNLTDLFLGYVKKETHGDPNNLYECDHCKKKVITDQKINLWILPERLTLVLKRYTETGTKLISNVKYQETLIIREGYSNQNITYKLHSTVIHQGSLFSGHYSCKVEIEPDNWILIDDDQVYNIKNNSFEDCDSYMLNYIRV